jgi:hypothetical protein
LFCKLHHPPAITEAMTREIFGRIPGTRNPPAITDEEFAELQQLARGV